MGNEQATLRVAEAAAVLGVSPQTLRRWDRSGKLPAQRHPLNNYRVYAREDIEQLATASAPRRSVDFIGRESELAELGRLFDRGERLVTILGPPGMGKTRLARELGGAGALFLELEQAVTVDGVVEIASRALGCGAEPARIEDALRGLGDRLVVLDNFEQVVSAAAVTVGAWLRAAPEARFLVTSRERLRIAGEIVFALEPLPRRDAARLFEERARAYFGGGALRRDDAQIVYAIVERLDGIPLAIELAAARVRVLGPRALHDRLAQCLDVLTRGRRDATARQATLRGAIDWSWNILDPVERSTLAQCSVFRGGFSLDAAETVLAVPAPVDTLLQALCDKSLVRVANSNVFGEPRFALYQSIREYAASKLDDPSVARRHCDYYVAAGEGWAKATRGPGGGVARRRLATEQDNLIAAHSEARESGDAASAVRAVLALHALMLYRGPHDTHRALLEDAVEVSDAVDDELRARIRAARGIALNAAGRVPEALVDFDAARRLARASGAHRIEGEMLGVVGALRLRSGDLDGARDYSERALVIFRELGDRRYEGHALGEIGQVAQEQGRTDDARDHYEQALAIFRELGDRQSEAVALGTLGEMYQQMGRTDDAERNYRASVDAAREVGDARNESKYLGDLATLQHERGRTDEAARLYGRAIELLADAQLPRLEGMLRSALGALEAARGRTEAAVSLLDAAEQIMSAVGDAPLQAVIDVHRGQLDLARGEAAAAEARLRDAAAFEQRSPHVRLAARLLRRAIADQPHALRVAADAAWIHPPHGERIDLRRRKPMWRIVARLAEHRRAQPGAAVTSEDLQEAGWPGEKMQREAGMHRVRVAVASLRKLGLRDLLLHRDEGYLLDPAVPLREI